MTTNENQFHSRQTKLIDPLWTGWTVTDFSDKRVTDLLNMTLAQDQEQIFCSTLLLLLYQKLDYS